MACGTITTGIPRPCRDNKGGVYLFYIASYPSVLEIATGGTNDEITGITSNSTAVEFFPYYPVKGEADFTETYQTSAAGVGYEQKITAFFSKMEASKANQIKMMALSDVLIVVKDKNGNYFLVGENDGVALSGGNAGSGKALTDMNGYNLELTALEGDMATQILEASININASTGVLTVE
jgi:hypothetical protein